ncbi:MAG: peptidylprolyl isomerase [Lewinella sp.]
MALIGKIRQNTIIVLLFIGGGVALFILSEMTSGANGPLGPVMNRMGQVGETEIDRTDFERTASTAFTGGDAFQNRDQLWQFYVNEAIMTNEADAIGLTVSEEEMEELQFGNNLSPVVQRNLTDPQTGQVNRTLLNQIRTARDNGTIDTEIAEGRLNPAIKDIWLYQTREIKATRLQEKMTAMVTKAMYAPSWQAKDFADQQLGNRQVAVVKVPFEEVDNTDVTVGDADIQAYIDENRSVFMNDVESRQLSYLAFNVLPTAKDSADLRNEMADIADDWRKETTETGDSLFALSTNGSYQAAYIAADRLSPIVADAAINQVAVGTVFGPYVEGNAMKLFKLIDRKVMSDSAKARTILRRASTPEQFTEAERIVDSLMNVLNRAPRKFAELAEEFSQDPATSSNGGLIEKATPGQYPRQMDGVIFGNSRIGELVKVRELFGWRLIKVESRSRSTQPRVKIAYVVEPILPSSTTESDVLAKAQSFLNGKNTLAEVKTAGEAEGMEVVSTGPLSISNYVLSPLGSGQEVKDMMCWAFSANKGDVSPQVYTFSDPQLYYQNNHVVVGLEDVIPVGLPTIASVKEALTPVVRNRVKGNKLATDLAGKDLSAIAAMYDLVVDTVSSNPTLESLPTIGREPKVIAAASVTATNSASKPVVGQSGVYVLMPLTDAATGNSGNLPGARAQINITTRSQASNSLLPALRATASVEDERSEADCQQN